MLTKISQIVIFIAVGVLLTTAPEWQNNAVMNKNTSGWYGALTLNAVFLIFAFSLWTFLRKKYTLSKSLSIQYISWGIFGLLFEWILLGHSPFSGAVQSIMFIYWGTVFTMPALFIEQSLEKRSRQTMLIYVLLYSILMTLGSLGIAYLYPSSFAQALLFIIFSWSLAFTQYTGCILKVQNITVSKKKLLLISIIFPLLEIILPKPLNFLLFLIFCIFIYKYISKNK